MEHFRDFLRFLDFHVKYDIRCEFAGGYFYKVKLSRICSAYHRPLILLKCSSALPNTGEIS